MNPRFNRSQVIQSVAITVITIAVITAEPNQKSTIRTLGCFLHNFLYNGRVIKGT